MKAMYPSELPIETYCIHPDGRRERIDAPPAKPGTVQALLPLLDRGGGPVPGTATATMSVALSGNAAQVFIFAGGELVAAGAIALAAGEQSRALWAWICGTMRLAGDTRCFEPPCAWTWAAVAYAPAVPTMDYTDLVAIAGCIPLLLAAIPAWVGMQN